jgi:hydroxypyruvate reductase
MVQANDDMRAARREMLREIYAETLAAIRVRDVFARAVCYEEGRLCVADLRYELAAFRRVLVVAIGKAAVPGVEAIVDQVGPWLPVGCSLQALVIGPGELRAMPGEVEWRPGSHPIPDESARAAAMRVVEVLQETGPRDLVLFLISGGASAMVELPMEASLSVEETAEFYRALVHSGMKIAEMNALRKHFSAVKGGRMAALAGEATQCTLLVSDVPEGMVDVIGSGPTLPDSSTRDECWELLRRPELAGRLPERVRAFLESDELPETPKKDEACFRRAEFRVVLSTETMIEEAARLCEERGFVVVVDNACDDWEYREAAEYLLERLRGLVEQHERVCLLSGGEVLVSVGAEAGRGGRNQQFALYCATRLAMRLEDFPAEVAVLSAGTDGIDGNSPAAGAVVDRTTVGRARAMGMSAEEALRRFDSYPLLEAVGDAIVTGPSGNNVRDLRILAAVRKSV